MKNILKNRKVTLLLLILIVCISIGSYLLILNNINVLADSVTYKKLAILTESDKKILSYYHEPKLEENFAENQVRVILHKSFVGEITFADFVVQDESVQIVSIEYNLETIYPGGNKKFLITGKEYPILLLELNVHSKQSVLNVMYQFQKLEFVLIAEPNYIYETVSDWVPSDEFYSLQWGLNKNNGINAVEAWDLTKGSTNIKVGLMENGADLNHEDLSGRIFNGNLPLNTKDNHGTHVAGILGAVQNNYGISGVSQSEIYLLSRSDFVGSINYAKKNGIKIINASFRYIDNSHNTSNYTALSQFDGLLVCSAGNSDFNNDNVTHYPSNYSFVLDNVIAVGALNNDGTKWEDSNYGKYTVDIYAPGSEIYSTLPNNNYGNMSGTSMAAPHVTGVAALLMSMDNTLTPAQIKKIICNSVDKDERLSDLCATGGRLNAYKALLQLTNKDENGYYFEEFVYQNFSMYHNIELNTICCRPDGSYEVMDNEQGILGGFNGMSVSLCEMTGKKINFSEWTFFECELVIYTQGIVNSGCYVYDDDGNYIDECTFSMDEGALHVPLNELFNRNHSSFLLIPGYAEESGGWSGTYTVGFSPSDVYLYLFARKYV